MTGSDPKADLRQYLQWADYRNRLEQAARAAGQG